MDGNFTIQCNIYISFSLVRFSRVYHMTLACDLKSPYNHKRNPSGCQGLTKDVRA